jgi:RNA polymerase sigma-70 factor (ECF subfamily)
MENEETVLEQAKQGDKNAFELLYKYYFPRIYRYCKANIYRDDLAADICQETFMKAWKALPTFTLKNGGTFQAFVYRIARNNIIDLSRKKKEFSLSIYEDIETEEDLVELVHRHDAINAVKRVLAKLPEKDRQILILRYFEDMSHKETAQIVGIREGALRVRTTRLLKKLKELMPHER